MEQGTSNVPRSRKKVVTSDAKSEAALAAYRLERQLSLLKNIFGYTTIISVALICGMMVSGNRFASVLALIGLTPFGNKETGVYADCSDPSNRNNAYCDRAVSSSENDWRNMRRGGKGGYLPFSLTGD